MYNAGDRKDIRRAEKASRISEASRVEFVRAALSTAQGREWFYNLLAVCHIFADPFTGDALREAYSKGERNIGLWVYHDVVTHCPDYFVKMMQEAHEKELTNARRNADTASGEPAAEWSGDEDADRGIEGSVAPADPRRWVDYGEGRRT